MAVSLVGRSFLRVPRNFMQIVSKAVRNISDGRFVSSKELCLCPFHRRYISSSVPLFSKQHEIPLPAAEVKKLMESLTDKFREAREMLDDARESQGTIYFSDDMKEAQQAVEETLTEYKQFLEKLSSKQRQEVISTLGLRMEELKAQKAAMEEGLKHD